MVLNIRREVDSFMRILNMKRTSFLLVGMALLFSFFMAGCASDPPDREEVISRAGERTIVLGAYSVARDALSEIIPAFQAQWKEQTGETIRFQESYEASGTQARAITGGFEADVTLLAMEGDVDKLVREGLVDPEWKSQPYNGMVTRSIVVLGTREGNPKGIRDFDDLTRSDVKVLYPNPKTSGGAQWDINAIYGAGLKQSEENGKRDPAEAKAFLEAVHRNVESLDKSGRASMAAFEYGVGDVIVTYENELLARIAQGVQYDIVVPQHTMLIENPAAVVERFAEKHGTLDVSAAFVEYLRTPEAQSIFVKYGFRPVEESVFEQTKDQFSNPPGLFDIEYLGGWDQVRETLYSKRGVWYQVLAGL